MSKSVLIVIPARYGSVRLPGKPLVQLCGKPMIQWTYERAMQVPSADGVVVATDDARIVAAVREFGGHVLMTAPNHGSGTERLTEVMGSMDSAIYINVQGDEPLVRPMDVDRLAQGMLTNPETAVGTLYHAIGEAEAQDPNVVKVVLGAHDDALYFSRLPIPYARERKTHPGYRKHIGVYGYRRSALEKLSGLSPCALEQTEQLEQLRWLAAGVRIRAFEVAPTGPGVDTPGSLERVRALLAAESAGLASR